VDFKIRKLAVFWVFGLFFAGKLRKLLIEIKMILFYKTHGGEAEQPMK